MLTPGVDPLTPQFSLVELRAAVEEAHRFGRKVTVHAHGAEVVRQVVEAGVDGIEHGGCWTVEGAHADPALIDRIAEAQIAVCPTLGILPPELLPDMPPLPPVIASRLDRMKAVIAEMHRRGVRLIAGSDAGIAPVKPHDVLPYSLLEMAHIGLSNAEALRAATSLAADACGLGDRKGRLAAGKDADILAVAGNPLDDLGHSSTCEPSSEPENGSAPTSMGTCSVARPISGRDQPCRLVGLSPRCSWPRWPSPRRLSPPPAPRCPSRTRVRQGS